jgi:hypothetical protein
MIRERTKNATSEKATQDKNLNELQQHLDTLDEKFYVLEVMNMETYQTASS